MAPTPKPHGRAVGHRQHAITVLSGSNEPRPPCPSGLLKSTRQRWGDFWRSDVSKAVSRDSDMGKLERWIMQVDEYTRAAKVFKSARLVKGSTGQPTLNPLAGYMSTLEAQISKAETEFGMGPLSRLKLGIALGEAHKSLAEMNAELEETTDDDDARLAIIKKLHE